MTAHTIRLVQKHRSVLYFAFPSGRGACVKVDLSTLEQGPLRFDERLQVEPERLDNEVVTAPVAVHLVGEVRSYDGSFTVSGRCEADGSLACSRCLESVPWNVAEDFSVEYRQPGTAREGEEVGLDEDDLNVAFMEGDELDMVEIAAEQVLLSLPMRILCNESCAGLCPRCGENLNRAGVCSCPPEVDPRWAALADLGGTDIDS